MSREIKFRLIKNRKVVGYERWNSLAGKWCYDTNPDGCFDIRNTFIPHTDKDQFADLKDKKRTKEYPLPLWIYERDIVMVERKYAEHTEDLFPPAKSIAVIRGWGSWFKFIDEEKTDIPMGSTSQEERIIIGNVTENPELLEEKK